MKFFILSTVLCCCCLQQYLHAQALFEDKEGETAITLRQGGLFRLNTKDASLKISYTHEVSSKMPFFGFDLSGKTNDGILPVFADGQFSPGFKVNGVAGLKEIIKKRFKTITNTIVRLDTILATGDTIKGKLHNINTVITKASLRKKDTLPGSSAITKTSTRKIFFSGDSVQLITDTIRMSKSELITSSWDFWLGIKGGYEGASFDLFNSGAPFANQFYSEVFRGYNVNLFANLRFLGKKVDMTYALSLGYDKANNYSSLTSREFTDVVTVYDSASNISRSYKSSKTARVGAYDEFTRFKVNFDAFLILPGHRFALNPYWRSRFKEGNDTHGFGIGGYLLVANNTLASIVGVAFEVPDVSNVNNGFNKSFTVLLNVGVPFGF